MSDEAVFEVEGERFVPGPAAIGPWAGDRLHGGPVNGLIAHALEAELRDPELVLARLNVDMFRPVPAAPLALEVETLRKGARLVLLRVSLIGEDGALAQATALLLRASDAAAAGAGETPAVAVPHAVSDLPSESLMRGMKPLHAGFHTRVETRWVPRSPDQPLAIWFRMPFPLIAGVPLSPLVSAIALADFVNAIASLAARERGGATPFINADTTLYLTRRPQGEWLCLQDHACTAQRGLSIAEAHLYDEHGFLGHALQARLVAR